MKQLLKVFFVVVLFVLWCGALPAQTQYDDPATLAVKNTGSVMLIDGKLDELDWNTAPTLLFGPSAYSKKLTGEQTVTNGISVKDPFEDPYGSGNFFRVPYKDSSVTKVKFLRKGLNLYIGFQSDDKSICKFDWEGDGMFAIIKNKAGQNKEYKLYWQNLNDTIRYEEPSKGYGSGAGILGAGGHVNDTTQVDNGYTAELLVRLDSLGYDLTTTQVPVSLVIFDPDGFQHPMNSWDHNVGAFFKTWWGSEWGSSFRMLNLIAEPKIYDDPATLTVKNTGSVMLIDGKLDELDWKTAPTLLFGPSAYSKKLTGEQTVTNGISVKDPFEDPYGSGNFFRVPYKDSSVTKVKFLRKGLNLYIGFQSDDKSICKFDWEGDGMFAIIKNKAGQNREYKLYWQNLNDTIRYEEPSKGYGSGAGILGAGGHVNDTTQVDNGYTAELLVRLDSLGYDLTTTQVPVSLVIFDPDGFQHPMNSWDHNVGAFFKTWWGSEWGSSFRMLNLIAEPKIYDDPATLAVKNTGSVMLIDGKLDELDWNTAPTLLFGPSAYSKKLTGEQTVTNGISVKDPFEDPYGSGNFFRVPYKDSSVTKVKFLRKGLNLYIGFQSDDKSICKFDWEGDGMFAIIKNKAGQNKEYKLYWQNLNDTIRYEEPSKGYGSGAGILGAGGHVNDTTQVDNGYTAELLVRLDSLGYDLTTTQVPVSLAIFDPDGFQHPMNSWDHNVGAFFKTWWGSEWGSSFRMLNLIAEPKIYDDPATLTVKNTGIVMLVDGKLDELDWKTAPTLLFGPSAYSKKLTGEQTVTNGISVKDPFEDPYGSGNFFRVPYKDSSVTKVKFLRKGLNLYIGFQSDDKSICKFDWEGDGMFAIIKNKAGQNKEYKLYWQNLNDTIRYEEPSKGYGSGGGILGAGGHVNDTTQVDNGYTAELLVRLDSLGYDLTTTQVPVSLVIFDPDGFQHPMNSWDHNVGAFFKTWWGSEWGSSLRMLNLTKEAVVYDNPDSILARNATAPITVNGNLSESDWVFANTLVFGPGAYWKKTGNQLTVTGGISVKDPFEDPYGSGNFFRVPYTDSSIAKVKFLRKGMNLYIGIQSDDKSVCKFDWEGDGLFMVIKNKAGQNKEYKLYWQNLNDTIKYEEPSKGYGSGAGILGAGGHVNDTAQVDNGYTAELMVQLDSLGYDVNTIAVPASMVIFDPDGFVHPMNSWDHTMGAFFKTWWGSEWGSSFRYIKLDKISDVADGQSAIPKIFSLEQNYPNPFNPSTTIEFGLPVRSNVTLEVYDIIGRVVATLYKGEMGAGYQHITFNASKLASGIYIYRLSATSLDGSEKESFVSVKKLVLLK